MSEDRKKRIVYLTAGAGGMYCGSCMHDNTLVRALIQHGLDVQLVPTYTPIRTDENDISADQVFFGGINVYLQQKIPLFRYVPRVLDRFLDRPGLIRRVSSRATNLSPRELGKLTVSMLKGEHGFQRKEVKRLSDWLKHSAQPDLIALTNILIGGCIPTLKRVLQVPAVVCLQGDDVFLETLPEPYKAQALQEIQRVAEDVAGFITHSQYYADFMSHYLSIPREKFHVTPLGMDVTDYQDFAPPRASGERELAVGYFARLAPEKGLHVLVDAFIELRRIEKSRGESARRTKLLIAGWLGENDREYAESQFAKLRQAGLADDFEHLGSVDREGKLKFFQSIDLLAVPTIYHEPKGLFALEAMAAGVPVLLPAHGAFPEMISETQGGLLTEPGSARDLAEKLDHLLTDHPQRHALGQTGQRAVHVRRNSAAMAEATWRIFQMFLK